MTILLSIEGNIGSGKSTLVEKLKEVFGKSPHVCFLDEPVQISGKQLKTKTTKTYWKNITKTPKNMRICVSNYGVYYPFDSFEESINEF